MTDARSTSAAGVAARRATAMACAALLLAVAPWSLTARAQAQGAGRDTTVRLERNAVVDITARTGRVIVRGTDGTTGTVRGTGNNYELRSTGVTLTLSPSEGARGTRSGADVEVEVPRGVRLVISTISADVDVRDVTGGVEVRTTSGSMRLENVGGRVITESISGTVRVTGPATQLRSTTVSGGVVVRDVRDDVYVHTTSGDVTIAGVRLARVTAETMSGDVQLEGTFTTAPRLSVRTHSGDVSLRLPADVRGQLELSTFSGELFPGGPITLLPGEVTGTRRGRTARLYAFGDGTSAEGLRIDITTFNGDVRLLRGSRP
jgi:hypothetical protein